MSADSPWRDHRFVFVGGLHRSGTTFLAQLIGSSSQASALENTGVRMDEGQFLQDVYPTGAAMGGVTRWAFDPRAHLTEKDADATPHAAERLWNGWHDYWRDDAELLVEKTPLNLTKTRFLQSAFPQSRFVIVTRHPLTQALAVRKWAPRLIQELGGSVPSLVKHWLAAHDLFREDQPLLAQVHVVRYESLMSSPEAEVDRLEEFLGIEIPRKAVADLDTNRSRSYEREWAGGVTGPRIPGQRVVDRVVFPHYDRAIRRRYDSRIRDFGYDLDDLGEAAPWT